MKAEDLMIGDWVKCLDSTHKEKCFAKIEAIEEYHSILVKRDIENWFLDLEVIEPIPLTSEIFEKNGFIIKKKWAQMGNFGDSPLIMWHFKDDPFTRDYQHELEIHDNETGKIHVHIPCEYVHELQHALRLCDIEKEIVV